MMNTKNCSMFTGRFVKDPELKTKGSGKSQVKYCLFTLAVNRKLTSEQRKAVKNGDDIITADFPQFTAFGEAAQIICDYFEKGKPITIHAEYQTYTKDDGNGNKEYKSNFVLRDFDFVEKDSTQSGGNATGGSASTTKKAAAKKKVQEEEDDVTEVDDDDVPF